MNPKTKAASNSAFIVLLLLVTGGMLVMLFFESRSVRRTMDRLQDEVVLSDERIERLEGRIRELESNELSVIIEPHGTAALEHEIARLSLELSNVMAAVQGMASVSTPEAPEAETRQEKLAGIETFRTEAGRMKQIVSEKRNRLAQIAKSTNIPDEIATMPIQEALDTPSLKEYWPYFEARKELERAERLAAMLTTRARSAEINLHFEESGSGAQGLQQVLVNQQFLVDEAAQRMAHQLSLTRVPDELAGLPAETALKLPSLAPYWPYFEAKQQRNFEQQMREITEIRLQTETLHEKAGIGSD